MESLWLFGWILGLKLVAKQGISIEPTKNEQLVAEGASATKESPRSRGTKTEHRASKVCQALPLRTLARDLSPAVASYPEKTQNALPSFNCKRFALPASAQPSLREGSGTLKSSVGKVRIPEAGSRQVRQAGLAWLGWATG